MPAPHTFHVVVSGRKFTGDYQVANGMVSVSSAGSKSALLTEARGKVVPLAERLLKEIAQAWTAPAGR